MINNEAYSTHLCNIWLLPLLLEKFLGHQVSSYGQLLSITFTSEIPELLPNHVILLLQGSGITLSADLSPQPVLDHDPAFAPQHSFIVRYTVQAWGCQFVILCACFLTARFSGKHQSGCLNVWIGLDVGKFSLYSRILLLPGLVLLKIYTPWRVWTIPNIHALNTAHPTQRLCCRGSSRISGNECSDEPAPLCAGCHVDLAGTEQHFYISCI